MANMPSTVLAAPKDQEVVTILMKLPPETSKLQYNLNAQQFWEALAIYATKRKQRMVRSKKARHK